MHFGCISRIQGTQRIVSPVQSLQIFSSELLGVRRALQGSKLEVGCGHNQWHSTSVCVTCKSPKHTNTSFQFLVTHKYTFLCGDTASVYFFSPLSRSHPSAMRNNYTGYWDSYIRHFSKMLMTAAPCNPKYGNGAAFSI